MRWRYNRTHRSRKKKHQQRMSLQSLPLQKRTLKKSSITSPKFSPVSATTTAMGTLGVMHLGMARVVSFSADRPQHRRRYSSRSSSAMLVFARGSPDSPKGAFLG